MSDSLRIKSHRGEYDVLFGSAAIVSDGIEACHVVADRRVAELHGTVLDAAKAARSLILVDAVEDAKSLERLPDYAEALANSKLRRGHRLVAIGGGVIQDITCFLAAVMLRGVEWEFYPTTLLAQADSCIGSKSSLNVRGVKNIVGTFTPPRRVVIDPGFLDTLDERDMRSGFGEILKVCAIENPTSYNRLAADYSRLMTDRVLLGRYIRHALQVKKHYVEMDEFDRGPRLIFNYGHSFGHAIESVTGYAVPHGIAVTLGMDMANFVSREFGVNDGSAFERMHPILRLNYQGYEGIEIDPEALVTAMGKDKKNLDQERVTLILPGQDGALFRDHYPAGPQLRDACARFLREKRLR